MESVSGRVATTGSFFIARRCIWDEFGFGFRRRNELKKDHVDNAV